MKPERKWNGVPQYGKHTPTGIKEKIAMNDVIQKIYDIGIVPVIAIDDADKAVPLAKALVKGGLPAAEVTFPHRSGRGGHQAHRGRST